MSMCFYCGQLRRQEYLASSDQTTIEHGHVCNDQVYALHSQQYTDSDFETTMWHSVVCIENALRNRGTQKRAYLRKLIQCIGQIATHDLLITQSTYPNVIDLSTTTFYAGTESRGGDMCVQNVTKEDTEKSRKIWRMWRLDHFVSRLQKLNTSMPFHTAVIGSFPSSITDLTLDIDINYPPHVTAIISAQMLPKKLLSLRLTRIVLHGMVPMTLTHLHIEHGLDQYIDVAALPQNLETLTLRNCIIRRRRFGPSNLWYRFQRLVTLDIDMCSMQTPNVSACAYSVLFADLPPNLVTWKNAVLCPYDDPRCIPATLQSLHIHDSVTTCPIFDIMPMTLTNLHLGTGINTIKANEFISSHLTHLAIDVGAFMHTCTLPSELTHFTLLNRHSKIRIKADCLPKSLLVLRCTRTCILFAPDIVLPCLQHMHLIVRVKTLTDMILQLTALPTCRSLELHLYVDFLVHVVEHPHMLTTIFTLLKPTLESLSFHCNIVGIPSQKRWPLKLRTLVINTGSDHLPPSTIFPDSLQNLFISTTCTHVDTFPSGCMPLHLRHLSINCNDAGYRDISLPYTSESLNFDIPR
jgi:hypothetical protein